MRARAESKVVLASNNPGKLKELRQLLSPYGVTLLSQADLGITEADETGLSFVENAIIKARHACSSGLPAIADDSGLEVDALDGAPGIYSARYAGMQGVGADAANNAKLLEALKQVPEAGRGARFQCAAVYMRGPQDSMPIVCQGTWEGRILFAETGRGGFGYDTLFYVPQHDCASSELPAEEKNRLSHRGQALRQLIEALQL